MDDPTCAIQLGGDILYERAAERDIDQLDAPADAEHRSVSRSGRIEEIDFELVTLRVDAIGRGMDGGGAITARLDIRTAAEE
jgi:hypothetical protein